MGYKSGVSFKNMIPTYLFIYSQQRTPYFRQLPTDPRKYFLILIFRAPTHPQKLNLNYYLISINYHFIYHSYYPRQTLNSLLYASSTLSIPLLYNSLHAKFFTLLFSFNTGVSNYGPQASHLYCK